MRGVDHAIDCNDYMILNSQVSHCNSHVTVPEKESDGQSWGDSQTQNNLAVTKPGVDLSILTMIKFVLKVVVGIFMPSMDEDWGYTDDQLSPV